MKTPNPDTFPLAIHAVIVMSVVAGATLLGLQGTFDSASTALVYGAAIGYAGGQSAASAGARDTRKAVNGALSGELRPITDPDAVS